MTEEGKTLLSEFDPLAISPLEQLGHLQAFREALGDMGLTTDNHVSLSEVLDRLMSIQGQLTSEEMIGLSLHVIEILLKEGEDLGEDAGEIFFPASMQLIETAISTQNPCALFFGLEIVELIGQSRQVAESLGVFVSVMRMAGNPHFSGKILAIILNQQRPGKLLALRLLDELPQVDRKVLVQVGLYLPDVAKNTLLPLLMTTLTDKSFPLSRRNQAAGLLSRLGFLLDDKDRTHTIGECIRQGLADLTLLASALSRSGPNGRAELVRLLKSQLPAKQRSILCMFLRELRAEGRIPTLTVIIQEPMGDVIQSGWTCEGEIFSRMDSAPPEMVFPPDPCLSLSSSEAEALFRQHLSEEYDWPKSWEEKARILLAYSVLSSNIKGNIGMQKGLTSLLGEQLTDEDSTVRESALNSLGAIGMPIVSSLLHKVEK